MKDSSQDKGIDESGDDLDRFLHSKTFGELDLQSESSEELRLSRALAWLEALFEGSRDAIFISGADGGFVAVNSAASELTGYEREELLTMSIPDLHEQADLHAYEEYHDRIMSGEDALTTAKILRKDGRKVDTEFNNSRIVIGGTPYMYTTARDITSRKRIEEELTRERDSLQGLHETAHILQACESKEKACKVTVEAAEKILDLETCEIALVEGEYLVPKALSTKLPNEGTEKFHVEEGIAGKTFTRREIYWGNLEDMPEAKPVKIDYKSLISIPIGKRGVFQAISTKKDHFGEQDVDLATLLVEHLKETISRVELQEELKEQAIRDPLTNLYNRRFFNETLQKEIERARRYDRSLAFLMIDINRFKEINDRYTHLIGDRVLQEMADLLKDNVRGADTVVRYGGDEFLIMMPQTEEGEVEATVDRLKQQLTKWNKKSTLLDFSLTLSMGISHWNPHQDRSVEVALKVADRRMYEEKSRDF